MVNKITAILLLTLWISQFIFSYLSYRYEREACFYAFKKQENTLITSDISIFSFKNTADIKWEKVNKEFELNGKLYDVLSIEKNDTATIIRCISDEQEQLIVNAFYSKLLEKDKDKKDKTVKVQLETSKYLIPDITFILLNTISKNPIINSKSSTALSISLDINAPPPRI